jgi:hypothetical protein
VLADNSEDVAAENLMIAAVQSSRSGVYIRVRCLPHVAAVQLLRLADPKPLCARAPAFWTPPVTFSPSPKTHSAPNPNFIDRSRISGIRLLPDKANGKPHRSKRHGLYARQHWPELCNVSAVQPGWMRSFVLVRLNLYFSSTS